MSHSAIPSSDYSSVPWIGTVGYKCHKETLPDLPHKICFAKETQNQNRIGPWRLGRTLGRADRSFVPAKNIDTGKLAAVKIVPQVQLQETWKPAVAGLASPDGKTTYRTALSEKSSWSSLLTRTSWGCTMCGKIRMTCTSDSRVYWRRWVVRLLDQRGKLQEFEAVSYSKSSTELATCTSSISVIVIWSRRISLLDLQNIKIADFGMAALEIKVKLWNFLRISSLCLSRNCCLQTTMVPSGIYGPVVSFSSHLPTFPLMMRISGQACSKRRMENSWCRQTCL